MMTGKSTILTGRPTTVTGKPAWHVALCLSALVPAVVMPGVGVFGCLAIVLLTLWLVRDSRGPTLALIDGNLTRTVLLGIGGGIVINFLATGVGDAIQAMGGGQSDLSNFDSLKGDLRGYLTLLAIGIVSGGVIEELCFRGFIVGWGSALLGQRMQIPLVLLSSVVFGFSHIYQGWPGVISTGFAGMMVGFLYVYAKRKLLVTILAHSTINVIGFTSLYLGV
jgi:membrane protease YdiL (CAAX protease family)